MGIKRKAFKRPPLLPHTKINALLGFEELLQRIDSQLIKLDKKK
jgi:hypothetical protein